MKIGIVKETADDETRVAMIPANVQALQTLPVQLVVEPGAGSAAGYSDQQYRAAGAMIAESRQQLFAESDIVLQVQGFGANKNSTDDLALLTHGQCLIGMMDPLSAPKILQPLAIKGVTTLAMELIPRISRAQSMDVLSSMATIAGYKAVLIGAVQLGRLLPMLMTAAGTLSPARVLVMGAGVAGLQAAATAKRLGAVVSAYDVRAAAREQILSVGAKPIELALDTEQAEGEGGYASQQSDAFIERQQELLADVLAEQDMIITTAAIPGARAPLLITAKMMEKIKPGAVIVDLAAERGGNCAVTQLGETVVANGVAVMGPNNIAATVPQHASQLFGKNMENLLRLLINKEGELTLDFDDQIIAETVVTHGGEIRHAKIRDLVVSALSR